MKYLESKLVSDDTKVLIEDGILDECLSLTEKGERILLSVLLLNPDTMSAVVTVAKDHIEKRKAKAQS